jgi:hypothetical protein
MHRLSLGQLTAIGLTTPEIIYLAADLDCAGVTINPGIIPVDLGGPVSRLDNDPAMRRATAQALADTGVKMDMMEPVALTPDFSFADNKTQLEIFGELGATMALSALRGYPREIVLDNGPEMTSTAMFVWAQAHAVQLRFIQPGKPVQNAFAESFIGRLRDECLNEHWFGNLLEARRLIEGWRQHYNERRPHSSLGYQTPAAYARQFAVAA